VIVGDDDGSFIVSIADALPPARQKAARLHADLLAAFAEDIPWKDDPDCRWRLLYSGAR